MLSFNLHGHETSSMGPEGENLERQALKGTLGSKITLKRPSVLIQKISSLPFHKYYMATQ